MRITRLSGLALAGACSFSAITWAQDVPTPPPAGVVGGRMVPRAPVAPMPAAQLPSAPKPMDPVAPAAPAVDALPPIPSNPIKPEPDPAPVPMPTQPQPEMTDAFAQPAVVPAQPLPLKKPAPIVGPLYYYPPNPWYAQSYGPMQRPMDVPNSPYVEDLSVNGLHGRYPYYSYRRPWYTPGQLSRNVTIVW